MEEEEESHVLTVRCSSRRILRCRGKHELLETPCYTGPLFTKPITPGGCGIGQCDEATVALSFPPDALRNRLEGMHARNALQ